ncbi:MAG TPA: ParB N-terminal domain-containing protein [Gemmatimonadales bacterium]
MAEAKSGAKPKRRRTKKEAVAPRSRGGAADTLASGTPPAAVGRLGEEIEVAGGSVIGAYRDPLGGQWQLLAALPIDSVEPTPYQRDLSEAHVTRLSEAIDRLGRFLDPIVVVPSGTGDGKFWTPNGNHRLASLRKLGAKAVTAIIVPEAEVGHRILLLNTEKAHNLRERALEVSRLAEALAGLDDRPEQDYAMEFEEPALLTLGLCYQENGRFAGGAYHPVLRRTEEFSSSRLSKSLETRRERAARVLELDEAVTQQIKALKERGFESPYLRAFVVARINPLRFKRGGTADVDETLERMLASARKFDSAKIRADQVASAGGAPEES